MKFILQPNCNFGYLLVFSIACLFISCKTLSSPYQKEIKDFRKEYKSNFNKEAHSPLKGKQLRDMRFYAPDSTYRVIADVQYIDNAKPVIFTTSSGENKEYLPYIYLDFSLQGKTNRLIAYKSIKLRMIDAYKNYLFLPFNDATNGEETYGGGRYLDLSTADISDKNQLIIDFNKAYNPYCSYSAGYSCPIPPMENRLDIAIEAGEKNYAGEYIYDYNK